MAFRYLFFLLSLTSCLDEQEIRTSSSSYDELSGDPHYQYVTYLNYENESLVDGHREEIEHLSTVYNLDIECINYMLVDYLNFIRNDKQNYSEEFIEELFKKVLIFATEHYTSSKDVVNKFKKFKSLPALVSDKGELLTDKFSYRATLKDIQDNDYNLNIPRCIDTFEEEKVDIKEINNEIIALKSNLGKTEEKMQRFLKELNLI